MPQVEGQYSFLTHFTSTDTIFINNTWVFSGAPVVKNLPSNAGDVGLSPSQGTKIPHAGAGGGATKPDLCI